MGKAGVKAIPKPIYGVAFNDASYLTQPRSGTCPIYRRWTHVLRRVLDPKEPSFGKSKICEEWLYYSNFEKWMRKQYWEGLELDKDILGDGTRIYSPKTCAFVPQYLNQIINCIKPKIEGSLLIGVGTARNNKFIAKCNSDTKPLHLGTYNTEALAHAAWQEEKSKQIYFAVEKYAKEGYFRTDLAEALVNKAWTLNLQRQKGEFTYEI